MRPRRHQPLPPSPGTTSTPRPAPKRASGPSTLQANAGPVTTKGDPNRRRANVLVGEGDHVYQIWVKLRDAGLSTTVLMTHEKRFDEAELKRMVKEATEVVNGTRIPHRRQEWAKRKVRLTDPDKLNEESFAQDIAFFEAVMVDKFDFKKLLVAELQTTFDRTVLCG